MSKKSVDQAIQLIRSGDKKSGGKLLAEIVKNDPHNETAWLWLAACFDKEEKKKYCLKKALEINPDNTKAWEALEKLSEEDTAWQNRLDLALEKEPEQEPSTGMIRGATVFDTLPEVEPPPPGENQFERTKSFTGIFILGFFTVASLIAIFFYVLISRGILFPPTPEKTYAKEMRSILSEYDTWEDNKAQFDAALAGPYSGVLSPTGGTAMTASDALFAYLALLSNPSEEINNFTARNELADFLAPSSEAAYLSGQTILTAMDASQPPTEVQDVHQQFYTCIQQETRRARAVNQIVTSGVATGFNINSEACAALPENLSVLRRFARDH
ncbi:MAG: hypothetical protein K8R77_15835 [Anaerolineaceae bacterium]|nr:hypothetical protein [Anaerolineaceae bacterium]